MILANRYEYDPQKDRLGKGGFGSVFKAYDKELEREVALKFVPKSNLPERYSLLEEMSRIRQLEHPNLVKYYDFFTKKYENVAGESDEMQIGVMEYVNGGDLGAYMKLSSSRQELQVRALFKQILLGLQFLHQNRIIHRDIKPQNILLHLEGGTIIPKIADFSISKQLSTEFASVSAAVGTYEYMSPEQLGRSDHKLGPSTDIWSFGVLAYQLLSGELPFGSRRKGDSDGQIIANIIKPDYAIDFERVPSAFRETIEICLKAKPEERFLSAADVIAHLETHFAENKGALEENFALAESLVEEWEEESANVEETLIPEKERYAETILSDHSLEPNAKKNEPLKESPVKASKVVPEDYQGRRWAILITTLFLIIMGIWIVRENPFRPDARTKTSEVLDDSTGRKSANLDLKEDQEQNALENEEPRVETTLSQNPPPEERPIFETGRVPAPESEKPKIFPERNKEQEEEKDPPKEEIENLPNRPDIPPSPRIKPPVRYDYVEERSLGKVVMKGGKYGFLSKSNKVLIPLIYDDFAYPQEGLAPVKKGGKWGFVDLKNQVIIPFKFDRPGNFKNGRAEVSRDGVDYFIDRRGNCVENCN